MSSYTMNARNDLRPWIPGESYDCCQIAITNTPKKTLCCNLQTLSMSR
jgi:hypothetical protein